MTKPSDGQPSPDERRRLREARQRAQETQKQADNKPKGGMKGKKK